jgi:uncharacterized protein YgiM (DUF1202 family)
MHLLFLLLIVVISSCTCLKTFKNKQPNQYEQHLEKQNRQLITKVESLEQKLLSKQDEIKKFLLAQHQKNREVVRTKAKLRSHSSKAETVANIAEVKTVLKAVADIEMNERLQHAAQESERVIAMSIEALQRESVDKAFNLSNKAQQLIQPIRTFQGVNVFKNGLDIVFIVPFTMKVLLSCNVRRGPGVKNTVLFTLESGTQIKALTYSKNWIQIEDETLRKGWVYYKLLEFVQ